MGRAGSTRQGWHLPRRGGRAVAVGATVAALAALTAACSADPPPEAESTVIVALGDSYSVGYRPVDPETKHMAGTDENFPNDLAALLSEDRRQVTVANFGCAGATSEDLVETLGCDRERQAPDGVRYSESTQADAAEVYLQANQGRVRALTVVIGGNDVTSCFDFQGGTLANDPGGCVYENLRALQTRLDVLLPRLRSAAGPDVPIVGLTYPDIFLGLWVTGGDDGQKLARESLDLFRKELNPLLEARYAAVGAHFVDLTDEFGGDVPLTTQVETSEWGKVPEAVAQVCEFTYACTDSDTHPTPEGHERIARAVQAALEEPAPTASPSRTGDDGK